MKVCYQWPRGMYSEFSDFFFCFFLCHPERQKEVALMWSDNSLLRPFLSVKESKWPGRAFRSADTQQQRKLALMPLLVPSLSTIWLDPFTEPKWCPGNPHTPRASPTWPTMSWSLSYSEPRLSCCSTNTVLLLTTSSVILSSATMETLSWAASSQLCQPALVLMYAIFYCCSHEARWDGDLCLYKLV